MPVTFQGKEKKCVRRVATTDEFAQTDPRKYTTDEYRTSLSKLAIYINKVKAQEEINEKANENIVILRQRLSDMLGQNSELMDLANSIIQQHKVDIEAKDGTINKLMSMYDTLLQDSKIKDEIIQKLESKIDEIEHCTEKIAKIDKSIETVRQKKKPSLPIKPNKRDSKLTNNQARWK